MDYYLILSLPFLLILSRILLTNFIVPHFKRKKLYHSFKQRSDWPHIEKNILILTDLFKDVHAKTISIAYRFMHFYKDKELIYGEIEFLSFFGILEKTEPSSEEIFYDLGSGSGKAVFTAEIFFHFSECYGIELLTPLYSKANEILEKASKLHKYNPQQLSKIKFINDSFLNYDFSDANIIYIAATCLNDSTWALIVKKMAYLQSGSRVIVATKSIQDKNFELIYQGIELMSWGLCPVKIYKVK